MEPEVKITITDTPDPTDLAFFIKAKGFKNKVGGFVYIPPDAFTNEDPEKLCELYFIPLIWMLRSQIENAL